MNNTPKQTIAGNGAPKNGERIPEPVIRYFKTKAHATGLAPGEQSDGRQQAALCLSELVIIDQPLNDIPKIDEHLAELNAGMRDGTYLLGSVHTEKQFKAKVLERYPHRMGYWYFVLSVLIRRTLAGVHFLRYWYFKPQPGRNWIMSDIEAYGRLFAAGFSLESVSRAEDMTYFLAKKAGTPYADLKGCASAVIKLPRVGRGGKMITVYKFRTMYPYSQFLQEYIFTTNGLQAGGKFKDDPRITPLGRIMRKLFIDEWPNLINLLKGDIKVFGVRAISDHYLSLYPEEHRAYRSRFKPGLIPPNYVGNPKTIGEIVEVERAYLQAYERNPFLTDLTYFFRAFNNIVFKGARSH